MTLAEHYPHLAPTDEDLEKAADRLDTAYRDYVAHISPARMAISQETAAYILWACETQGAATAVDFGSGFTSYVLRYAGCDTVSVDDSPEWLHWTGTFLERYEQTNGQLVLFDHFRPRPVDVVVYDFGGGQLRNDHFVTAIAQIGRGGIAILDDAHFENHQKAMRRAVVRYHYDLFSLEDYTRDWFDRYAALVVRP
jgi:predicted O-methyltransferase YrrM